MEHKNKGKTMEDEQVQDCPVGSLAIFLPMY